MAAITRHRAISEVAKLMLKNSPIEIVVTRNGPEFSMDAFYEKLLGVQDMVPSFVMSIQEHPGEVNCIEIQYEGKVFACIGNDQPDKLDCVWIPMDGNKFSKEVATLIIQFADAGYPGCEGCLGEDLNVPWDEEESRASMLQYI